MPLHPLEVLNWQGKKKHEYPSMVILPSLPPAVTAIIQEHNQQALQLLLQTLKQHMTQGPLTGTRGSTNSGAGTASAAVPASSSAADNDNQVHQELCLPLSGCCYAKHCPPASPSISAQQEAPSTGSLPGSNGSSSSPLLAALASSVVPSVLSSPFMALCGAGDDFGSLSELMLAGRQCLRLHAPGVPLLALQDRRGRELAMNAWALDYFKHGQKSALVAANGLLEGDAWTRLKSMSSLLAAISLSLKTAVEEEEQQLQQEQKAKVGQQQQQRQAQQQQHEEQQSGSDALAGNQQVVEAFASLAGAFHERLKGFSTNGVVYGAAAVGRRR